MKGRFLEVGSRITESPWQQSTVKKDRRKKKKRLASDLTNQNKGAWLQLTDYKIQKQNGCTGLTSGRPSVAE